MHPATALPARTRAQLTAVDVHIARGGRPVLHGVDLAVAPGQRLGIVGENGRGKSTLLHILAGLLTPDAGTVARVGAVGVAEQEMTVADGRSVGDLIDIELAAARAALRALDLSTAALVAQAPGAADAYAAALEAAQAMDAWDADRRVDVALDALGAVTDRSRLLGEMSVGQRYRVRLACLLGAEHDFLLLDEPTNHLDRSGLDYLSERLRATRSGVVLVTHDRALLRDVVTSILDLDPSRDGRPRRYGGGYPGYQAGRRAERERWAQEYEHQQAEHARLTEDLAAAQSRLIDRWRPEKGTPAHQRATRAPALVRSVHRRRDDLEDHAVTMPAPPLSLRMPHLSARPGVTMISATDVLVEHRMIRPVSVTLDSGARLIVAGPNGSGKSTLLSVLAGLHAPSSGTVHIARHARVTLLAQESPPASRRRARDIIDGDTLTALGLLAAADLDTRVCDLSIGQQRRLELARALATRPHVLLLDEPTNHLSIALVDEVTEALAVTEAAVVVATHDRQLRRDLAHWPSLHLEAA